MRKNGIKSFVFSFLLSLLAVIAVNKAVFRAPAEQNSNKKVVKSAQQSISLFSEQKEDIAAPKQDTVFHAIENLVAQETTFAENSLPDINVDSKVILADKTDKDHSQYIVYEQEDVSLATQDLNIKHKSHINLANASEIILEKDVDSDINIQANRVLSENDVVYSDISDTLKDEKRLEENNILYAPQEEIKDLTVANINNIPQQEENIIPITENKDTIHNDIDILTSAENSQIAMLEPNSLVNSIDNFDKPEEKNISEINLKKEPAVVSSWTQMSGSNSNQDDSPWVVAKGNRFAKNKIAQIDVLEEEVDETKEEDSVSSVIDEKSENKELNSDTKDTVIEEKVEQISDNEVIKENNITVHKTDDSAQLQQTDNISKEITSEDIEKEFDETDVSLQISNADNNFTQEAKEDLSTENDILSHKPLLIPSDGNGTKLAYKMIQNLIIPLPEDIATDADIVPQLSSEPNQKPAKISKKKDKELKKEEKESGLFKSISSWFSKDDKDEDNNKSDKKQSEKNQKTKKSGIYLFGRGDNPNLEFSGDQGAPEIMPAELKLSFQPNRAEISGHTLRWIHAFADNARDNQGIYIEIRIDGTSSFALQQKRLNLLSSIFANRGVDFRKVNIIFTSREPNSFIIRNIKFNDNNEVIINDEGSDASYQYW